MKTDDGLPPEDESLKALDAEADEALDRSAALEQLIGVLEEMEWRVQEAFNAVVQAWEADEDGATAEVLPDDLFELKEQFVGAQDLLVLEIKPFLIKVVGVDPEAVFLPRD